MTTPIPVEQAAAIGKAFSEFYYRTFDTNRTDLQLLYRELSTLTWEGQQFRGAKTISDKLISLPFQRVSHRLATVDAQPSNPGQPLILVMVTGQLLIDEETNPQHFSETFQLVQEDNSYWIFNDVFRLNYG